MGLNFPNAPTVGQLYPSPPLTGAPVYQWDGQKWVSTTAGNMVRKRFWYSATAGQITFSGADGAGATLSYTPGFVEVAVNGMLLPYTEYTATDGTSITLASGSNVNDVIYVIPTATYAVADTLAKSLNGSDIIDKTAFKNNLGVATGADNAAWINFTPTLTWVSGGAGTASCRYKQIGKTVFILIAISCTTTGIIQTGTIPVTASAAIPGSNSYLVGREQAHTGVIWWGYCQGNQFAAGNYSNVSNMNAGDSVVLTGVYEAA
jgi:hypothetical protein